MAQWGGTNTCGVHKPEEIGNRESKGCGHKPAVAKEIVTCERKRELRKQKKNLGERHAKVRFNPDGRKAGLCRKLESLGEGAVRWPCPGRKEKKVREAKGGKNTPRVHRQSMRTHAKVGANREDENS